jgi:hypothetical protein
MKIARPALPLHPTKCMMVSTPVDVTIGLMRLALAGRKSMGILARDTWNPKCVQTSFCLAASKTTPEKLYPK